MENNGNAEQALDRMIVGAWVTQAIYVAAEIGIADRLSDGPRTADDLGRATRTCCGASSTIGRMRRRSRSSENAATRRSRKAGCVIEGVRA